MIQLLVGVARAAALGWIVWRMMGAKPFWRRPKPCRWRLRAAARDGFPARWRCATCKADVSAPEGAAPERCFKLSGPQG